MNAFIDDVATPLLLFVGEWSLRWTILAVLPIGWLLLRPPRSARLRYDLCLVTVLAGLALPLLPRWGGVIPSKTTASSTEQQTSFAILIPSQAIEVPPAQPVEPAVNPAQVETANSALVKEPFIEEIPRETAAFDWNAFSRRGLIAAVLTAWIFVMLLQLARWIAGSLYLHRLRQTSSRIDAATKDLLAACRQDIGLERDVRLAMHTKVASPLTFGVWEPVILLPTAWQDLSPELQRGCLLHELAHVKRRDAWLALWLQAVGSVFVFHPCVRWLRARLECEREMLCDEMALACGVDGRAYATMLRDFATQSERLRSVAPALPFGQGPTVKRRIQQIMEQIMVPSRSTSKWIWLLGAAVLAGSVAIGSLGLQAAADAREEQALVVQDLPKAKPEQPAQPLLPKEQFMYGGKCFEEWEAIVRADLKPEVRMEAFRALSTFGKNGYADQAARAIIEIAASYDPMIFDLADQKVLESASQEIFRLGSLALPALQAELQGGKTNGRRFSAMVLKNFQSQAKPAAVSLERALEDEDAFVRSQAALCLNCFSDRSDPAFLKILVDMITNGMESSGPYDMDIRPGLKGLEKKGKLSRPFVSQLTRLLGKRNSDFDPDISQAILHIGGDAKAMVPFYRYMWAHDGRSVNGTSDVLSELAAFGKEAKSSAPDLIIRFQNDRNRQMRGRILDTLMAIEAEPKDVIPLVKDFLANGGSGPGGRRASPNSKYEEYLKNQGMDSPKPPNGAEPNQPNAKPNSSVDPRKGVQQLSVSGTLNGAQQLSASGTLQKTNLEQNGRRFYRLTPDSNEPSLIYCVAQPGVDLEAIVDKHVQLAGKFSFHAQIKQYYLEVETAKVMP